MRARRVWLLSALVVSVSGCTPAEPPSPAREQGPATGEWFTDRAEESGLRFVHFNGMSGHFYQPEIMAPGVALFDYDNDGDLDVFLVQGRMLGSGTPLLPLPASESPTDRLFRNDLSVRDDGTRTMTFTDVTERSGIRLSGYGMGVAAGDIDNDGHTDLFFTGFGRSQMFRNNGNGTFSDVSKPSGTADSGAWSVPAAFVDVDRDGWLDLFVGNYLNYSLEADVPCFGVSGLRDYCRPSAYRPLPSRLYRNNGAGRFSDVTIQAGLAREYGPALGVSTADFDGDGWVDLFVANDEQENQLWINQRDGTFVNKALLAGAALGAFGERKANMGVDAGDFDNDGDEDLFITELVGQGSTLYVNDGKGLFEEQSATSGVRGPSLPFTGFGAAWIDIDNDSWLDVVAVNGHVNRDVVAAPPDKDPFPLGQRSLVLRNVGGRFEDATARAGKALERVEVGRGAAFGDVDNDGDVDVLVGNGAGPVRLLVNDVGSRQHWVGLRLVGRNGRDMAGARVGITLEDGRVLWRRARADGSYASANDPRVLVGLGRSIEVVRVHVVWPSAGGTQPGGQRGSGSGQERHEEVWRGLPLDRYTTLTQGSGSPIAR
jgi:enediyne biosynthesis protein E4